MTATVEMLCIVECRNIIISVKSHIKTSTCAILNISLSDFFIVISKKLIAINLIFNIIP